MIYLYTKEVPSGLKYLGQTVKNPYKYNGSGTYWKNYLKKHDINPKDIRTTIILETEDRELIREKGLYYSKLWNVVESNEWANLCIEMGDYGSLGHKPSLESIERRANKLRGKVVTAEKREKLRISNLGKKRSNKTKEANRKANLGKILSEEHKKKISEGLLRNKNKPKYKKGKCIINTETGEIYKSIRMASKVVNIPMETFRNRLNNLPELAKPFKYLN